MAALGLGIRPLSRIQFVCEAAAGQSCDCVEQHSGPLREGAPTFYVAPGVEAFVRPVAPASILG